MPSSREETIHGYITDMLALEEHIDKAVDAQVSAFSEKYPAVAATLRGMQQQIRSHRDALGTIAERHEGDAAQKVGDAVKRAGSMLLGLGAAAIDLVRTEKLPKNLRDDYTAFSLASIGYVMLETTALALERTDVASMAQMHLQHYAQMLMTLQKLIPEAVLEELRSEELAPIGGVATTIEANIRAAWQGA